MLTGGQTFTFCRQKIMGKTWKTIDNKVVETPVTDIASEALIRDFKAEGKLVYINDLEF